MEQELNTMEFIAPSGYKYVIREENGADEEIISNQAAARNFMNVTNFIAAIVVSTDATESGKLTPEKALQLPLMDRYAILVWSRIFSLGDKVEFSYIWPGDKVPVHYEQDLNELILTNYQDVDEDEKNSKPEAIPEYKDRALLQTIHFRGYELELTSGKKVKFDIATGETERYAAMLPEEENTRNSELLARNLHLEVNGKFEKVGNFSLFTVRELAELRKAIHEIDPLYSGLIEIEHPSTGEKTKYPIFGAPRFFFLTEA